MAKNCDKCGTPWQDTTCTTCVAHDTRAEALRQVVAWLEKCADVPRQGALLRRCANVVREAIAGGNFDRWCEDNKPSGEGAS